MPREEAGLQARSLPQALKGAIYLRLERAEEADGRLVVEGENLGEKDAAHARLPAERPVGACCMLMRKLSPHFLLMPGKSSTSRDKPGMAVFITPISKGPMWF